ncbi:MAG: DUF917 family protein [Marmoricola sp.]
MLITQDDIPALARGCAVLGTGGGGEVTTSALIAHQALSECGPVEVVTLADLPLEGILMPVGMIGAPSVSIEKLSSGTEIGSLRRLVEHHTGQPVVALMVSEIGGGNGVLPAAAKAARSGLPLLGRRRDGQSVSPGRHDVDERRWTPALVDRVSRRARQRDHCTSR